MESSRAYTMNRSVPRKIIKFKKTIPLETPSRPLSSSTNKSTNSFLVEIDHNFDIDAKIRKDIERKYKNSSINACYKFPRSSVNDSKFLPKIKLERNQSNEDQEYFKGVRKIFKINQEKLINRDPSFSYKSKIPTIKKKIIEKERKNVVCSITPSPYLTNFKSRDSSNTTELKKSTPTPTLKNKISGLRYDRQAL